MLVFREPDTFRDQDVVLLGRSLNIVCRETLRIICLLVRCLDIVIRHVVLGTDRLLSVAGFRVHRASCYIEVFQFEVWDTQNIGLAVPNGRSPLRILGFQLVLFLLRTPVFEVRLPEFEARKNLNVHADLVTLVIVVPHQAVRTLDVLYCLEHLVIDALRSHKESNYLRVEEHGRTEIDQDK